MFEKKNGFISLHLSIQVEVDIEMITIENPYFYMVTKFRGRRL
jgi:hypothetical protein